MIEIINTILLSYLCIIETISVYRLLHPKKRSYNRKSKEQVIRVIRGG